MKLIKGMKVRLRNDLHYSKRRHLVVPHMLQYAGTVQTITAVSNYRNGNRSIHINGFVWDSKDAKPISIECDFPKPELFDPTNLNVKGK